MTWVRIPTCALCGVPTWPNLWRWCGAIYCSQTCLDIDLIPERVPAYPMQSNYAHLREVEA